MKKIFRILLLALLVSVISACSNNSEKNNESKPNTITVAELTEKENAILSTTSDSAFVFDFETDSEYEEISVWIEKYELGKLVDNRVGHLTTQAEQSGTIIFTTEKNVNEQQGFYHIGIGSNSGVASISGFDTDADDLGEMSSVWGSFQEEKNLTDGEILLAALCYSDDEDGMRSLTTDFYEDTEGNMRELEEYDVAYLLKTEFNK